ncbi:MAG: sensor histidine kinase [Bryobacteraceae bacterium]
MTGRFTHKFKWKRVLLVNTPLALIIAGFAYTVSNDAKPQDVLRYFCIALVYSFSIGCLAHGLMPYLWAWSLSKPPLQKWPLAGLALILLSALGCLFAGAVLTAAGIYKPSQFWLYYKQSLGLSTLITVILGGFIISYETMRAQLQQTTLQLRTKELERERALNLATEARLSSLESRIHPHFLFNTLNSISSLIQDDPKRAERLVEQMAALLRFSLDSGHAGLVPLHQEMKIVLDYLEIERARFGDRLRFAVEIPADLEEFEVPPLSIQTLVENSVKYAIAPRREGGVIRISAIRTATGMDLRVWDDGPGFTTASVLGGHGLDNLQARLSTLFTVDAGLGMERNGDGMSVVLSLPRRVLS